MFKMEGPKLLKPTELYNALNQFVGTAFVSDPCYLALFDCRAKENYDEGHIITAKRLKKISFNKFMVPFEAELECKWNVVVYDGNSSCIDEKNEATKAAMFLQKNGSRNRVMVLEGIPKINGKYNLIIILTSGGYERFTQAYPFLRTQMRFHMPKELEMLKTYPLEVIENFLYIGTLEQAGDVKMHRQLNITAHVNCNMDDDPLYTDCEDTVYLAQSIGEDSSDLSAYMDGACDFMQQRMYEGRRVLIFSQRMLNRAASMALAYLIKYKHMSLKEAWRYLRSVCTSMQPSWKFMESLAEFEAKCRGTTMVNPLTEREFYCRHAEAECK